MESIKLKLSGKLGHFKKPETGNNPCTYSYMHKCAFLGFAGAVLGINRKDFNFKSIQDNFLYGIKIVNPVVKEPISFTKRTTTPSCFYEQGLRYCEYIKNPVYEIIFVLKNKKLEKYFFNFKELIKNQQTHFPVYFGVISCQCDFELLNEERVSEKQNGVFKTQYVFSNKHKSKVGNFYDFICETVPFEEDDMFYTNYIETVCPSKEIELEGDYYMTSSEQMWLI